MSFLFIYIEQNHRKWGYDNRLAVIRKVNPFLCLFVVKNFHNKQTNGFTIVNSTTRRFSPKNDEFGITSKFPIQYSPLAIVSLLLVCMSSDKWQVTSDRKSVFASFQFHRSYRTTVLVAGSHNYIKYKIFFGQKLKFILENVFSVPR